jgi:hypothetical protein
MIDRAERLLEAARAAEALRGSEEETERLRQEFYDALRAAHAAGANYAEIGRVVSLTRQRVARIIVGGR